MRAGLYSTTTVPRMPVVACTVHSYLYVPAAGKLTVRLPDFAVSLWAEKSTPVTSWNVSPDHDQVTLPPAATVTRAGENWLNPEGMPTLAPDGALLA